MGRHTNKCDYCEKNKHCPQCKDKGFMVEDLDDQIKRVRKGDILLIKSLWDFPIGWIIRHGNRENFNHCAWVVDKNNVIELGAKSKRTTPIKKYLNKWFYKCKLLRIKDILPCKLNEALRRAEKAQFNYSYFSFIVNLVLIKLKILKKSPRLSCSGFIAYYLAQVGFFFNGIKTYFITLKDIENSKKVVDISKELYQ